MRNRPPPPAERTPLQGTPTWPGPPSALPPEKEEEDQQRRLDRWDRRERAMECARKNAHQGSGEVREEKQWESASCVLLRLVFDKKQVASCQLQRSRGRMGYSRFAVIELNRAIEVADATCFATNPQNNRMSYRELQEAIEYTKERRSGLQEIETPRERGCVDGQDLGDGKREGSGEDMRTLTVGRWNDIARFVLDGKVSGA